MYDSTDTTLQTVPISTGTIAASTSFGPIAYDVWNDKGSVVGSDTLNDALLIPQAFNGVDWVTSGLPVVDEGWVKVQFAGVKNPGNDSTLATQTSGYVPCSSFHPLPFSPLPKNCARILNVRIDVPAGAADVTQNVRLALRYNQTVYPLGLLTSLASGGAVMPDRFDLTLRRLVATALSGIPVTASGAASVAVVGRWYVYDGLPYFATPQTVALNQTDGAAAALTVGTSYIATLSQAVGTNTVTTTKGTKAASPVAPAVPANQIFLAYVTVAYQGGGTSIINQGNVDSTSVSFGEFFVTSRTGSLVLTIGAGSAITTSDTRIVSTKLSSYSVPDNAVFYLWMLPDGTFTSTATVASPAAGAIRLASGNSAAGAINRLSNDNISIGRAVDTYYMFLRYKGPLAVGSDLDWDVLPYAAAGGGPLVSYTPPDEWYLERVYFDAGSAPVGGADTKIDVNYRPRAGAAGVGAIATPGTTIYTSQATTDYRPKLETLIGNLSPTDPLDSSLLGDASHEVRVFPGGTRFSFDCDAVSTTPPVDVIVQLQFRRLR
jgi:hypothetical protein